MTAGIQDMTHPAPMQGRQALAVAMAAALLAIAPLFVYPVFLMEALCFALFASAFNILAGYVGLLSFGHAAFFGSAAYVTAHALARWGWTPELGILLGVASATALAAVFGWLANRRQGIYFAMVTLAFAQLIYFVALQAEFTGGEDGIQNVPQGRLLGIVDLSNVMNLYVFVCAVTVGGLLFVRRVLRSPFGEVLGAIRTNEQRAISLGYDVDRYKLIAFILSGALSGLAGATKVLVFQVASLTDVHWHASGEVILMTLVGGFGTLAGPVVGAFVIKAVQSYLAFLGGWLSVIQGMIFILCVLLLRNGVMGAIRSWFGRKGA
jgi:branched-chain amino acid transport system permease protein